MKPNTANHQIEERVESLINGERIQNFSDTVFAFAATLLVLKIDLPQMPAHLMETQFYTELYKLAPSYAANFLSFLIIAYYWRAHHKLFILIKRFDTILLWLNTLVLIFVAFLPFPIDLFGEYSSVTGVVEFYTASLMMVGLMLLSLWLYASWNHRLIDKNLSSRSILYHSASLAIAPSVFLISLPIVAHDHVVAKLLWAFVIILAILLDILYKRNGHATRLFRSEPV